MNKNKLLIQLLNKQLKDVKNDEKLCYSDLVRISRKLQTSIFGENCSIWGGNIKAETTRRKYVNFFFHKKKHSLSRLLYANFVGKITKNDYIKYTCENVGRCCSISHILINNHPKDIQPIKIENNKQSSDLLLLDFNT